MAAENQSIRMVASPSPFANEDHRGDDDEGASSSSSSSSSSRSIIIVVTTRDSPSDKRGPLVSPQTILTEQCDDTGDPTGASALFDGTANNVLQPSTTRHGSTNDVDVERVAEFIPRPSSSRIRTRRDGSVISSPNNARASLFRCYANDRRCAFHRRDILRLGMALLLVSCLSHVTCSTTMHHQHQHQQHQHQHQQQRRRRIRRRNNTGFYYGIRDDDMMQQRSSSSSSSSVSSLRLPLRLPLSAPRGRSSIAPSQTAIRSGGLAAAATATTAEDGGTAESDGAYCDDHGGTSIILNRQRQQQQHRHDDDDRRNSPLHSMAESELQQQQLRQQQQQQRRQCGLGRRASLASVLRGGLTRSFDSLNDSLNDSLTNYGVPYYSSLANVHERLGRLTREFSHSLPSMLLNDRKRQHLQVNTGERAVSLPGGHHDGGGGGRTVSQQQRVEPRVDDDVVLSASTTTESKNRQKGGSRKRRKNNTGFYYGIREDVLENDDSEDGGGRKSRQPLPVPPLVYPEYTREDSTTKGEKHRQRQRPSVLPQVPSKQSQSKDDEATNKKGNGKNKSSPLPKLPKLSPRKKMATSSSSSSPSTNNDSNDMSNILLDETMLELRGMREEIIALREELRAVKNKFREEQRYERRGRTEGDDDDDEGTEEKTSVRPKRNKRGRTSKEDDRKERSRLELESPEIPKSSSDESREEESSSSSARLSERRKRREFERISKDVEKWASEVLDEELDRSADGWKAVVCNKFIKKKFNKDGRTEVYVKWMPDSRDEKDIDSISATAKKSATYPCLKIYTTIDAPLDRVCSFLSQKETIPLYNELVVKHDDVEEISPNSKITWTQCPKILIVKPRDFVTYCSHRWLGDGTQVLVNQACEHEDRPGVMLEGEGNVCRAFALRGANFISKDPDDPNKTRITMLSHANPGGGLPQWALTTAVNAVVAVEPFKFLHRINEGVCNHYQQDEESTTTTMDVVNKDDLTGRSNKPAGIAHLGFTCLWPNGGGLKVGEERSNANPSFTTNPPLSSSSSSALPQDDDDDAMWRNDISDGDDDGANDMEEFDD